VPLEVSAVVLHDILERRQRAVVHVRSRHFGVTQRRRLEAASVERVERDISEATIRGEPVQLGPVVRGARQLEWDFLQGEMAARATPQEEGLAVVFLPGEVFEVVLECLGARHPIVEA